jgi:hypothetical protein
MGPKSTVTGTVANRLPRRLHQRVGDIVISGRRPSRLQETEKWRRHRAQGRFFFVRGSLSTAGTAVVSWPAESWIVL